MPFIRSSYSYRKCLFVVFYIFDSSCQNVHGHVSIQNVSFLKIFHVSETVSSETPIIVLIMYHFPRLIRSVILVLLLTYHYSLINIFH